MNGDTFSIKAPKEYSKKFAPTLRRKFLTRGNVLRIVFVGWSQVSGRRTSGSSRPSLRVQVLAVFFLHFLGKIAVQKISGKKHLEVPDILLPDTHGLLTFRS